MLTVILTELMLGLGPGIVGGVSLEVGETFVDLGLVTHTGDPTAIWVTQGRHQDLGITLGAGETLVKVGCHLVLRKL